MTCPADHKHNVHCHQAHGCRCDRCRDARRAANAKYEANKVWALVQCSRCPQRFYRWRGKRPVCRDCFDVVRGNEFEKQIWVA